MEMKVYRFGPVYPSKMGGGKMSKAAFDLVESGEAVYASIDTQEIKKWSFWRSSEPSRSRELFEIQLKEGAEIHSVWDLSAGGRDIWDLGEYEKFSTIGPHNIEEYKSAVRSLEAESSQVIVRRSDIVSSQVYGSLPTTRHEMKSRSAVPQMQSTTKEAIAAASPKQAIHTPPSQIIKGQLQIPYNKPTPGRAIPKQNKIPDPNLVDNIHPPPTRANPQASALAQKFPLVEYGKYPTTLAPPRQRVMEVIEGPELAKDTFGIKHNVSEAKATTPQTTNLESQIQSEMERKEIAAAARRSRTESRRVGKPPTQQTMKAVMTEGSTTVSKPGKPFVDLFHNIKKVFTGAPVLSEDARIGMWRGFRKLPLLGQIGIGATVALGAFKLGQWVVRETHNLLVGAAHVERPVPDIQEVYDQIDEISGGKMNGLRPQMRHSNTDFGSPLRIGKMGIRWLENLPGTVVQRAFMRNIYGRGMRQLPRRIRDIQMPLALPRAEGTHIQLGAWLPGRANAVRRSVAPKLWQKAAMQLNRKNYRLMHKRAKAAVIENNAFPIETEIPEHPIVAMKLFSSNMPEEVRQELISAKMKSIRNIRKTNWSSRQKAPSVRSFKRVRQVTRGRAGSASSTMRAWIGTDRQATKRPLLKPRPWRLRESVNGKLVERIYAVEQQSRITNAGAVLVPGASRSTTPQLRQTLDISTKWQDMEGAIQKTGGHYGGVGGASPIRTADTSRTDGGNLTLSLARREVKIGHGGCGNALVERRHNLHRIPGRGRIGMRAA